MNVISCKRPDVPTRIDLRQPIHYTLSDLSSTHLSLSPSPLPSLSLLAYPLTGFKCRVDTERVERVELALERTKGGGRVPPSKGLVLSPEASRPRERGGLGTKGGMLCLSVRKGRVGVREEEKRRGGC
jgi:hypothetical protein